MNATVFGGSGLLGRALLSTTPAARTLCVSSEDVDLRNREQCNLRLHDMNMTFFHRDIWINAAAKVGGIKANTDQIGEFARDNLEIGLNVVEAARRGQVGKLVSVLSTCIYPNDGIRYPLTEDQLHLGPPHDSNFGYAYAKRMLDVLSRAYRQQWGCNFITVVPNNLYGPGDNYDLNGGHVIPALIRKFFEAQRDGQEVVIWGSGKPLREFTYADDAAKVIWWAAQNYDGAEPINIGNTEEVSIGDLASTIGRLIGFTGNLRFDPSKPDGQYRKPTSNMRLLRMGCFPQYTPLEVGLRKTIEEFAARYPNVRGVKA